MSFDEAKRASGARRRSASTPEASVRRSNGFADFDYSLLEEIPFDSASKQRGSKRTSERMVENAPAAEDKPSKKESWFSKFKRDRAKGKAGRAFTKQYGDTSSSASQGGPRAAVYKGEMGAMHKRAARMQESASSNAPKRGSSFGIGAAFLSSPKFIAAAAMVACVVLTGAFLYPSAQQFYLSVRENDRLQAEYEAVQARNEAIQQEVDALRTQRGIEDRARGEFGWSYAGDRSVTVQGLNLDSEASSFEANIVAGSVEAPDTWYSEIFDPIFGLE